MDQDLVVVKVVNKIDVELDILVNEGNLNNDVNTKDSNYVNVDYVSLNAE